MSDSVSRPPEGDIVSGQLPVPYVTKYTNRTPTLGPMLVTGLSAWATYMIEWGSLRWIDHAPVAIWIGSTFIAICVLTVLANREWLNFKNRRYFPVSLTVLMLIWAAIVGLAYYLDAHSPQQIDPAVANLQSQVATARRERDVAIIERDAAKRALENTGKPLPPAAPITPPVEKLKFDDVEARIDAWKGVESQMNDFLSLLVDGDKIVDGWKSKPSDLGPAVGDFRSRLLGGRNRLSLLLGTYPDFSDLKIIDQGVPSKLSTAMENLWQANAQSPAARPSAEYVASIDPFIGPFKRQIASVRQWAQTTKSLANSSVSELAAQQVSK